MAKHAATFLDGLGVETCDVLGFSLGGMVAQQMVLDRPAIFRRLILVGTAPRGGEDIMHLEKPRLAKHLQDPSNKGYSVLQKIFFTLTPSGQAAGVAFVERLAERNQDLDGVSGPEVANAQMAAFRDWERFTGDRSDLRTIAHPTLVVNGIRDEMIPIINSYRLAENLPNVVLIDVSGRRAWLVVPVPRFVRAPCSRVPLDQFRIGGLLTPQAKDSFAMKMINIYADAGTFRNIKKLATDAAALVKSVEQVPDIPTFRKNIAAFVHEMPAAAVQRGRPQPLRAGSTVDQRRRLGPRQANRACRDPNRWVNAQRIEVSGGLAL